LDDLIQVKIAGSTCPTLLSQVLGPSSGVSTWPIYGCDRLR